MRAQSLYYIIIKLRLKTEPTFDILLDFDDDIDVVEARVKKVGAAVENDFEGGERRGNIAAIENYP